MAEARPAGGAGLQAVRLADPGRRPAGLDRPAVLVGLDRGQIALTEAAGQRRGAQRLVDRRRVRTGLWEPEGETPSGHPAVGPGPPGCRAIRSSAYSPVTSLLIPSRFHVEVPS